MRIASLIDTEDMVERVVRDLGLWEEGYASLRSSTLDSWLDGLTSGPLLSLCAHGNARFRLQTPGQRLRRSKVISHQSEAIFYQLLA
jgi:hypothetical protein